MKPPTMLSRRLGCSHRELSTLRLEVADWLAEEAPYLSAQVVGDVEMVLSELSANVIDHTRSAWLDVSVAAATDHVAIEVANEGSVNEVPAVEEWGRLEEGERGRGLRIVRALSHTVTVSGDEDVTRIRCDVPVDEPSV